MVCNLARENIRFSSVFAARDVPSGEERGETNVFAGYLQLIALDEIRTRRILREKGGLQAVYKPLGGAGVCVGGGGGGGGDLTNIWVWVSR